MRFSLLVCLLAVALSAAAAAPWMQCNFLPNTTYLVLTNTGCSNSTYYGACVANEIPGQFIPYGSCVLNTNGPSAGLQVNVRYFAVQNSTAAPVYDYITGTGSNSGHSYGVTLTNTVGDTFASYWNDDSSSARVDLDVMSLSTNYRQYAGPNKIQVTIGNYVNKLSANNNGYHYLRVIVGSIGNYSTGYTSSSNVYFAGNGYTSGSVWRVDWAPQVWVAVWDYSGCVGTTAPIWYGYINGTAAGNDTYIALYGDYSTKTINVWGATRANMTGFNSNYTVCNFIQTTTGGTGWPENNVNLTLGAYGSSSYCGYLNFDVAGGVVPYGTCQTFTNGPVPGVYTNPYLRVNGTKVSLNGYGSISTYYSLRGDGWDFLINEYVDSGPYPGYAINDIHYNYGSSAFVWTSSSSGSGGSITATMTPASNQQTYIIGLYAANYKMNFPDAPSSSSVYIAFNNTYWASCENAASYYGRTCYTTVPDLGPGVQYNVTVYNSPCYGSSGLFGGSDCARSYVTSVKTTVGGGNVGFLAWYGDFSNSKTVQAVSYLRGGQPNSGTGGIVFPQGGAAASIVPQFAAVALAIVAAIVALLQ